MKQLSLEILTQIFLELESPQSFARTCREFRQISRDTIVFYLVKWYGKRFALYEAINSCKSLCNLSLVTNLIQFKRVVLSAWFVSALHRRYTFLYRGALDVDGERLANSWGTLNTVDLSVFASICLKYTQFYGEASVDLYRLERTVLGWTSYYRLLLEINQVALICSPGIAVTLRFWRQDPQIVQLLDAAFESIKLEISFFHFGPFMPKSFLDLQFAAAVIFEPRLLPLLNAEGWFFDSKINDSLTRHLLLHGLPNNDPFEYVIGGALAEGRRRDVLFYEISRYLEAATSSGFFISATVAGEIVASSWAKDVNFKVADARQVLSYLENDGKLNFKITDMESDLIRLRHGNRQGIREGRLPFIQISESVRRPIEIRALQHFLSLALSTSFNRQYNTNGRILGVETTNERVDEFHRININNETFGEKEEIYTRILCNEFLVSVDAILFDAAALQDVDCSTVASRCMPRLIRMSSKINLDLLKPINEDALDSSRPLFTSRPSFLSPSAFDYEHYHERYLIPLGPHPWIETCYYSGLPPDPEDPYISSSPWPAKQKEYFLNGVSRGPVNGATISSEKNGTDWISKDRVVKGSLPLAIALLDLFDPEDEVLEIVLMHSLLSLNPSVAHFNLHKGVPLRSIHLDALNKLNLPMMEAVRLHLEMEVEVREGVLDEVIKKKRKPRSKKKVKEMVVEVEVF